MQRAYNFSAGPATLPLEVLQQAQEELLNWQGTGCSVMELGHRTKEFLTVAQEAEADLRDLLHIPANYKVLFLQGGARSQFAMVPLNLLGDKISADYINTGIWSKYAIAQAQNYCQVNEVASAEEEFMSIPSVSSWQLNPNAAYFHYVDNETVNGVEFNFIPETGKVPLVSDMSSNLLSRLFDVSRFGLVYAGAQKNIGPAGITIVIIREDLLDKALPITPIMFNYKIHADFNSMYNTPPTFAWYISGLVFKWLKRQGGVEAIEKINQRKANKLYQFIDSHDFYMNTINPEYRSRMNIVFKLADEGLNEKFLAEAKQRQLIGLKGHSIVGGMRASIYNAMPESGIDCLLDFMNDFVKRYG